MGGAVAMPRACRVPEFSAAICFYGLPPGSVAKPCDVKVPLQGHFANSDDFVTPAVVDAFEKASAGRRQERSSFSATMRAMPS